MKKYFYKIEDLKINKEKLAYINLMELGDAFTIFNCKTRTIKSLLERQNYGEAKKKLDELCNDSFYKKLSKIYRFNQNQYYKILNKKKKADNS